MQWLKDIIKQIANAIGLDKWVTAYIGLALAILIVFAIVIAIIFAVRKKAKKKAAAEAESAKPATESAKTEEPVKAQEVKAEEVKKEEVKEEIKEEIPKEEPAPAEVKEEKPTEVVAEPETEEKPKEKIKDKDTTMDKTTTKKQETKATKPAAAKPAAAKPAAKSAAKPAASAKPAAKAKALGKWVIEQKSEDEFLALLFASNGEVMLTSETYSTEDGARKGIATIIKAVENGEFVTHKTKNGTFYFKLKSSGNRLLCAGEIYKERTSCENAVESVKRIAADSPMVEDVYEGEKYYAYKPVKLTEKAINDAATGKWRVETNDDGKFYATLYASNGQVMLSTEEVSTRATALSGIENVKKNALAGNFVIDKDKFGKYYYKLRNAQKSIICIGEAYKTADSCISALESVRKLAAKSPIVE